MSDNIGRRGFLGVAGAVGAIGPAAAATLASGSPRGQALGAISSGHFDPALRVTPTPAGYDVLAGALRAMERRQVFREQALRLVRDDPTYASFRAASPTARVRMAMRDIMRQEEEARSLGARITALLNPRP